MGYEVDRKELTVRQICEYVEKHLCEELTHARLQECLGVCRHDLVSTFKVKTGLTVTAYIIRLRLDSAVRMVQAGMGLEKAAYSSGFHTYSHFYKEFLKHFGISPRAYFSYEKRMEREEIEL